MLREAHINGLADTDIVTNVPFMAQMGNEPKVVITAPKGFTLPNGADLVLNLVSSGTIIQYINKMKKETQSACNGVVINIILTNKQKEAEEKIKKLNSTNQIKFEVLSNRDYLNDLRRFKYFNKVGK
jgi:hypothetical protein